MGMKVLVVLTSFLFFLTAIFTTAYFTPEYQSAFEADQQCHFEMSSFTSDQTNLGCDHDTETRQWLLFDSGNLTQPAEVLKRYKY